ncbi:MAG: hypothetical protein GY753_18385, partial [Gammaproteobacteria bacterium]|nr:hypothetical protein [Gammaproteobacteria bacterium]
MKIADSNIQMASSHLATERHEKRESLTMWRDGQEPEVVSGPSRRAQFDVRASSMVLESRLVQISAWASSLQPTKAALVDQEPPD